MEQGRGDRDVTAIGGDDGARQGALERFLRRSEAPDLVEAVLHLRHAVADGFLGIEEHCVERRGVVREQRRLVDLEDGGDLGHHVGVVEKHRLSQISARP